MVIGQFVSHSVGWGEPDYARSGCRCLSCGAVFCHREAFDIGVLAGIWSRVPCPQCGVHGSLGAVAMVPDRYRKAAETLVALDRIESEVDKRRAQRLLGDHGETAVEICLADELLEGFPASLNPRYLAMIAEAGRAELIDDTVVGWLIGRLGSDLDYHDRVYVYQSLARIAAVTGDHSAVEPLLAGLADDSQPPARATIAIYIAAIEEPRVGPALEAARSDRGSFPRSDVEELMPTAGQWFWRTVFNPFQIGMKQNYTVGEIATMCLRARQATGGQT
jgi:hypothetical protein